MTLGTQTGRKKEPVTEYKVDCELENNSNKKGEGRKLIPKWVTRSLITSRLVQFQILKLWNPQEIAGWELLVPKAGLEPARLAPHAP